jgi:hypothetical protein
MRGMRLCARATAIEPRGQRCREESGVGQKRQSNAKQGVGLLFAVVRGKGGTRRGLLVTTMSGGVAASLPSSSRRRWRWQTIPAVKLLLSWVENESGALEGPDNQHNISNGKK